ncbi:hypothetical protein GQ43DRAFT_445305 [Delitschia confertaspora ATCC 74209]|uniref:Rhodopsin domain-containing protein n=1 Tax=Delitschia confertaspora ATCC 74209 TaxID=1513339 RepID=A0A9P4MMS2_9PLEO|nr:hypothetical protein GQ43DRAFT_445305 [Delitschia confertaspora ATCC 74209]
MNYSNYDLSKIPAAAAPHGQTSNLVNPQTGQDAMIAISVVLMFFITVLSFGRLWHNAHVSASFGADDYIAAVAWVFAIVFHALILQQSKSFRHLWDIPASWFDSPRSKWSFALSMILGPATLFPKVAILLLYLRLFSGASRTFKILIYCTIGWCVAQYTVNIFNDIALCVPRKGENWASSTSYARCFRQMTWAVMQGVLNVFTDVWLLVLPLPTIFQLRLSVGRKMWLVGLFTTAILGVAASILGCIYRWKVKNSMDTTWMQNIMYLAVVSEIDAAIVCSCMPAFASWILHLVGKRPGPKGYQYGSSGSHQYGAGAIGSNKKKFDNTIKKSTFISTTNGTVDGDFVQLVDRDGGRSVNSVDRGRKQLSGNGNEDIV